MSVPTPLGSPGGPGENFPDGGFSPERWLRGLALADLGAAVAGGLLGLAIAAARKDAGDAVSSALSLGVAVWLVLNILRRQNWARIAYILLTLLALPFLTFIIDPVAVPAGVPGGSLLKLEPALNALNLALALLMAGTLYVPSVRALFTARPPHVPLRLLTAAGGALLLLIGLTVHVGRKAVATLISIEGERIVVKEKGREWLVSRYEPNREAFREKAGVALPEGVMPEIVLEHRGTVVTQALGFDHGGALWFATIYIGPAGEDFDIVRFNESMDLLDSGTMGPIGAALFGKRWETLGYSYEPEGKRTVAGRTVTAGRLLRDGPPPLKVLTFERDGRRFTVLFHAETPAETFSELIAGSG